MQFIGSNRFFVTQITFEMRNFMRKPFLMIYHKNELTLATNLSMVVNLIAQSADLTISLPPNEDYVPNTKGSVSLILLRSLGWLIPLVNVSSKMARFPAKRQTNEPPWKQTTSTLKI